MSIRPTNGDNSRMLAEDAGEGCFDIFISTLSYNFSFFFLGGGMI